MRLRSKVCGSRCGWADVRRPARGWPQKLHGRLLSAVSTVAAVGWAAHHPPKPWPLLPQWRPPPASPDAASARRLALKSAKANCPAPVTSSRRATWVALADPGKCNTCSSTSLRNPFAYLHMPWPTHYAKHAGVQARLPEGYSFHKRKHHRATVHRRWPPVPAHRARSAGSSTGSLTLPGITAIPSLRRSPRSRPPRCHHLQQPLLLRG